MTREAQTARSERTREALRQAAILRFLAQGVEETSAEQIAADAGVSLRTFYRHFASKHDLLFADYDANLHWFRRALAARPRAEPITDSVMEAIFAFPYDVDAVTQIAVLRGKRLDAERIASNMRRIEVDFAQAIAERLERLGDDRWTAIVTARCVAAAVFSAMELWMESDDRSLVSLTQACRAGLDTLAGLLTRTRE